MVIIGNPHVLVHDPNWSALLRFVASHGGATGSELPAQIVAAAAQGPYSAHVEAACTSAAVYGRGPAAGGASDDDEGDGGAAQLAHALSKLQMVMGGGAGAGAGAGVGEEGPWVSGVQVEGGELPRHE